MQIVKPPIEEFIQNFKCGHNADALVETFTQGDCYHFAVILKDIYPEGRIVYDDLRGHFCLELQSQYFDITGKINPPECPLYFDQHCGDENLYQALIRDCVYKIDYYPYGKMKDKAVREENHEVS